MIPPVAAYVTEIDRMALIADRRATDCPIPDSAWPCDPLQVQPAPGHVHDIWRHQSAHGRGRHPTAVRRHAASGISQPCASDATRPFDAERCLCRFESPWNQLQQSVLNAKGKRMRIAQIAPIIEDVPPRLYGGTERIVSYLTEELVALGHDVTLFASGTSITTAELVPVVSEALRLSPDMRDPLPYYMIMLDQVRQRLNEFDILHFHIDAMHYPLMRPHADRVLTTLHGRQDLPELPPLYRAFPDLPMVSITNAQRRPIPTAHFVATVHHGLPVDLYRPTFSPGKGRHGRGRGYLAFLGRMAPEKRPDLAIDIARKAGMPLKLAAKVDKADRAYFRDCIAPLLKQPDIEFIGEINEREKERFLGEAAALLFPISWPEPFGLVMIEAMACGTPVLAFRAGSVPEVIDHGVTGLIVETVDQAVAALPDVLRLDRAIIRQRFERRFTSRRMATDYITVYERQLGARKSRPFLTTRMSRPTMAPQQPQNGISVEDGSVAD